MQSLQYQNTSSRYLCPSIPPFLANFENGIDKRKTYKIVFNENFGYFMNLNMIVVQIDLATTMDSGSLWCQECLVAKQL